MEEKNPLEDMADALAASLVLDTARDNIFQRMASYTAVDRIDWAITLKDKTVAYFNRSFPDLLFVNGYINASWKKEDVDLFTVKYVEALFKAIESGEKFSAAELFVKTFGEFLRSI